MEAKWNPKNDEYFINVPIENQTLHMAFEMDDWTMDTVYFNVYMTLYNKRTQIEENESQIKMTGYHPMQTVAAAIKAFKILERETLWGFNRNYNVVIHCHWLDNRRRDAYYKFLSKRGYRYGKDPFDGNKWIFKKWKKGEVYETLG